MKKQKLWILLIILIFPFSVFAENDDNIIISDAEVIYSIIASKSGNQIKKVKMKSTTIYEATRTSGNALAVEFYNDYITIDKASGAKANYRHWISNDLFYVDSKVCYMDLPIKKKGGTAKAVFEKTYINAAHFTQIILPSASYFTKNKTIKIVVPATLSSIIKIVEKDFTPEITSQRIIDKDGNITYIYTLSDIPNISSGEPFSPPIETKIPRLYILGQFADLGELYKYLYSYTTDIDENIEQLNSFVADLTKNCNSNQERISKITEWVQQNIRYIAIEHGEYGTRPDKASEVFRKRYGDCKGMSSLLKAMFRFVGLDARLAWIGTEQVGSQYSEIYSLASGNHMICALINADSVLYVDGTSSYLPIGHYHPSIQGRDVLIEDGESNYILNKIPVQSPMINSDILHSELVISDNKLTGTQSRILTGVNRMSLCAQYNSLDISKRNDFINRFVSYPKKNVDITTSTIIGNSLDASETIISSTILENDACRHLGDAIYINLLPIRYPNAKTINLQNRKQDVLFHFPTNFEANIKITIPDGFKVKHIPMHYSSINKWFEAEINYSIANGIIKCNARFTLIKRDVALNEINQWNLLIRDFNQANSEQLVLTTSN